jgi:hypothetical protein
MDATVKQKYKNATKKIIAGDEWSAGYHQTDMGVIIHVAEGLSKKQKQKKLNTVELALQEEMMRVLPAFLQLVDKCMDYMDKQTYSTGVGKYMVQLQKKAAKGDKAAVKKFNEMVRMWGHHEPGKFQLIRKQP